MHRSRVLGTILASLLSPCVAFAETGPRPNIVLILADDMGYGDVHALNARSTIPTPHLDRAAREGMVFTDAHTPSSVCTPTRYGLLTGRYCWRTRLRRGVLNGYSPPLIDSERPTIATLLRSRGYHTAAVGKWHLGLGFARADGGEAFDFSMKVEDGPLSLGFDSFFGIPASLDMPPYIYVRDERVESLPTAAQERGGFPAFIRSGERAPDFRAVDCLDRLLREAVGSIRRRAATGEPFFLYFALTAPHKPVLPHPRFRSRTDLGPYGDFVVQVDATVGRILDALEEGGVEDRTLFIFTSDNGSFMYRLDDPAKPDHSNDPAIQAFRAGRHTSNHVFRGTKADIWEGGHRVPFLVRWPGVVRPGSRCDETICLTDVLATCAEVAGAKPPREAAEDSFSLLPLLRGEARPEPRPPVIHHSAGGMFAIRDGRWKLVLGNGSGGREKPRGKPFGTPYRLFDLSEDLAERRDVRGDHPEVVARLRAAFEEIRRGRTAPEPDAGR